MHNQNMKNCIDACMACYQTCIETAGTHCLEEGGSHVEAKHFRTMLACAEMCRTSAHIMLLGYSEHQKVCAACAAICEDCAKSCESIGGMEDCVTACRQCASTCREMAE